MFIDTTAQLSTRNYKFSLVKYTNPLTEELFNIGVVMQYEDGYFIRLNKLKPGIKNCIDLGDIAGINYSIELIQERIESGELHIGDVSNVLEISELKIYTSPKEEQDVFAHLVDEFISLSTFRQEMQEDRSVRYTKMQIIKSLKRMNINKDIHFHQHIAGLPNIIDVAYIKENKPIAIAEITSPHTGKFYENIATAAFTLSDTTHMQSIRDKFIYAPILTKLSSADEKKLHQAIETSKNLGVDIITKKNHGEILERLGA